jgi:fucose permease
MLTLLLLIIIYLSFISLGLPDSLLGSAWPSMYNSLNVPLYYAGFISMIIAGGTVISSVLSERIIRRFGTGIVTAVSVLMTAAALAGFSVFHSFLALCLLAVPLGLGAGSVDAALNNYVALHYKARHMSWLHCFWGIGASLGPIIMSAFLISRGSWNSGYGAIAVIQFCLVVFLFVSLPLWKKSGSAENHSRRNSVKFSELFQTTGVREVLTAFFCYCTIEATTGLWGASFLVEERGISKEIAAQWIALYYIGITSGRFISGFITLKLNNRQMIRMGQIIIGCGIIVLVLPFGNATLLPGLFMIGLGCAPIYPSLLHETPKNFGGEYSQAMMGIQMGSAYIGTTLMPPVFGWLASRMSFNIFPVFIGGILIIKIAMVEVLNKKIDGKRKAETE